MKGIGDLHWETKCDLKKQTIRKKSKARGHSMSLRQWRLITKKQNTEDLNHTENQKSGQCGSHLLGSEAWGNPGILLQRTARVIIRRGAPLASKGKFAHFGLHLQRHHNRVNSWLLSHRTSDRGCCGQYKTTEEMNLKSWVLPSKSFYWTRMYTHWGPEKGTKWPVSPPSGPQILKTTAARCGKRPVSSSAFEKMPPKLVYLQMPLKGTSLHTVH